MQDQAKHHGTLAYQMAQAGRWTEALSHVKETLRLAPADSNLHQWALHMAASIATDMGKPALVKRYAKVYLANAAQFPDLNDRTPHVHQAMGIAQYQMGRSLAAIRWYQDAAHGFASLGQTEQVAVTSSMAAFNYAKVGHPSMGRAVLADRDDFPADRTYLYDSALCAILHAEGRHAEAIQMGRQSLSADRRPFDYGDAAAIALLVARSLRETGHAKEATALIRTAAEFAVRQRWEVLVQVLLLNLNRIGGDNPHEAADNRGSSNPLDGASFTSGIA